MPDRAAFSHFRGSARRAAALPAGLVPLFLSREEAAAYLGVAPETFDQEVAAGWWPQAVRRGAKAARLTWYRPALESVANHRHAPGTAPLPTTLQEDTRAQAEIAAMEAVRHAPTPKLRPKHRPQKAR